MANNIFCLLPLNGSHPSCGISASGEVQQLWRRNHLSFMTGSFSVYPPVVVISSLAQPVDTKSNVGLTLSAAIVEVPSIYLVLLSGVFPVRSEGTCSSY